jgi:hypothetical protein
MRSPIRLGVRVLGAILLVPVALFCVYGFLASFEVGFPKFPNVFHFLYGTVFMAAVIGAGWLLIPAFKAIFTGNPDPNYWRWYRFFALGSVFSLFALVYPEPVRWLWLMFLGSLLFLIPIPAKPRTWP